MILTKQKINATDDVDEINLKQVIDTSTPKVPGTDTKNNNNL